VSDLLFRPVTELAELVRSGEVTSRELVEASLARIDEVDGEINAFTFTDPDGALAAGVYAEAVFALDVGARVFGFDAAAQVSAAQEDAAAVVDVAVYHLTGAPGDAGPALVAFRRAAGPLLERH
jgi:Asp-tRNA(Asn)/Glu-tRNA(Gln) amidotransferase A subunit family amidase